MAANSSGRLPVYQAGLFSVVTASLLFSSTVAIRRRRELHSTVLLNSAGEEKYHLYSFYQRMSALLSLFSAYISTVLIVFSVCQHYSHCSQRMSALFLLFSAYVSTVLIVLSVYQHCSDSSQRISALFSLFSAYVSTVLIVFSVCQHCSHCFQRMSALF